MSSEECAEEAVVQEQETETQVLTAEYKDGQLQIVEVAPFDNEKSGDSDSGSQSGDAKYVQVLDSSQLDLLNLALVRCGDGEEGYRLVSNDGSESDTTVTCMLQSDDNDEADNQESYVVVQGEQGPMVFLQSSVTSVLKQPDPKPKISPAEILEKAKALQKAKALMKQDRLEALQKRGRGRKRKGSLPSIHELLASPQFKLFLYSCKLCPFKCNAIKEMTDHKAREHGSGSKYRGQPCKPTRQCARCPYRACAHSQIMKHVQEFHSNEPTSVKMQLQSAEVEAADVLVCGACGFESGSRPLFTDHIHSEHGAG